MSELTQLRLKEKLSYCRDTGLFTRIYKNSNKGVKNIGGTKTKAGYIQICVDKKLYLAHRLAWLYEYGVFPEKQIDHINGVKDEKQNI